MDKNQSDIGLFNQIRHGNTLALTQLFDRYYQQLCQFTFIYIPDRELTEELTANVFINLWEKRSTLHIHTSLKAYLYRSAKNQALSSLRKNRHLTYPPNAEADKPEVSNQTPETLFIENELNDQFARAIKQLPQRAKLAFKLHRIDNLSYSETAEIMNISISAVEKNLTTALEILHRELSCITKID